MKCTCELYLQQQVFTLLFFGFWLVFFFYFLLFAFVFCLLFFFFFFVLCFEKSFATTHGNFLCNIMCIKFKCHGH